MIDEDFSDLIDSKNPAKSKKRTSTDCVDPEAEEMQVEVTDEEKKRHEEEEEELDMLESKKVKYIQVAKLYLSLGHFYLLIYDYAKALECYQKFFKFKLHKLQVNEF